LNGVGNNPDAASNLVGSVLAGSFVPPPPSPPVASTSPKPIPPPTPIAVNNHSQAQQEVQPTPNVSSNTAASNNINSDPNPLIPHISATSISYGPSTLNSLRMTLHGVSLRSAQQVFEWKYLTAIYEQTFYNDSPSLGQDYIQNNVYAFATELEVTEISYGDSSSSFSSGNRLLQSSLPSTTFTFTQMSTYKSIDPNIAMIDIVMGPFATAEYRREYVNYLKNALLDTFGVLDNVPIVAQNSGPRPSSNIQFTDTFFCAAQWPVICSSTQKCENDSDCPAGQDCLIEPRCAETSQNVVQQSAPLQQQQSQPAVPIQQQLSRPAIQQQSSAPPQAASLSASPYSSSCNLCKPDQRGLNNPINFNGQLTDCSEAYNFMAKNYNEGSSNCVGAQAALSETCCENVRNDTVNVAANQSMQVSQGQPAGPKTVTNVSTPSSPISTSASAVDPSSPTQIAINIALKENDNANLLAVNPDEVVELLYPSNTYYCGSSLETAAATCSISCSSAKDDECPGDLQCFGNTECMNRESFFCGSSWLDASDKCSQPCPTGDALDCDAGEACFAWTSCENTESFYCGVSFEDASSNCALPCPTRSSLDCPGEEQGCFAYTTCLHPHNETSTHETSPLHTPMNDNFCGESVELASSTCSIACQSGLDSECPGKMQCHDGTGCSSRDSFWCGSSWMDAAEMCTDPCSSGSADDCPAGLSCFAHTGCQANLFFCGNTFEDASDSCTTPCESRSSNDCPGDELCFAFVTDCASEASTQSHSFGIANTQWDLDPSSMGGNMGSKSESIAWRSEWEGGDNSSSSTNTLLAFFIGTLSLMLGLAYL